MTTTNRWTSAWLRGAAWALLVGALCPSVASAVLHEQVIELHPGWNSVFFEVEPEPNDPEVVFQGLPIASVWRWNPEGVAVDFIQDPADGLAAQPDWLGYFPLDRPEAFLTNLFAINVNCAHLVKLEGSENVMLRVRGRPSVRPVPWIADSFNLRGFHVNPGAPPSFGDFFAPSEAHAGQPIYRLGPEGVWERIADPFTTPVHPGEAYWVFSEGPSDYEGPIRVEVEDGDGMDYGGGVPVRRLLFHNLTGLQADVVVRQLSSTAPVPISYRNVDPVTAEESWPELPPALRITVEPDRERFVDLGVRRAEFTGQRESILEVQDTFGTRRLVAVSALTAFAPPPTAVARVDLPESLRSFTPKATTNPLAGLWVGEVSVRGVSESQIGSLEPKGVGEPFEFRIMVHVDAVGQARLLKEVIQMYQEGVEVPNPDDPGFNMVAEPGRYVLLTDERLLSSFTGAEMRDGQTVGVRMSTAAYDFPGLQVDMTGSFALGGSLTCTLTLEPNFPTNPFRHKFHPDHDNLDATFLEFREEAFTIFRRIILDFTPGDPEGGNLPPDWGESQMGGIYREVISGLHRNDIAVEGIFRMRRMSTVPVLNQ